MAFPVIMPSQGHSVESVGEFRRGNAGAMQLTVIPAEEPVAGPEDKQAAVQEEVPSDKHSFHG